MTESHGASSAGTPPTLRRFVGLVCAMGSVVLAHSLYALPGAPLPAGWLIAGALALVAGSFALKVPGVPVYLSISDTFYMTSCVLFGPAPATLTIALDSLVMSWRRGNASVPDSVQRHQLCDRLVVSGTGVLLAGGKRAADHGRDRT